MGPGARRFRDFSGQRGVRDSQIKEGCVKSFTFSPRTPILRTFDILADFRQQALAAGWKRKEAAQAIKEAISDGKTMFGIAAELKQISLLTKKNTKGNL